MYLVYKHTSPSGKSYIGLTSDYEDRCYRHQLKSSGCRFFAAAIKKYGWDNFLHEILYDNLTLDQANYREQQCINEYGSMAPHGYNLISGGNSRSPSIETRRKISATTTGRKRKPDSPEMLAQKSRRMTGRKASTETKAKLSAIRLGRTLTDEHKRKTSATLTGISRSTETRARMSASKIGKSRPEQARAVVQLTLDGQEIGRFASQTAVLTDTGIYIANCLTGRSKSAGGFIWRYA